MAGEIPTVRVNCCEAFCILDCFPDVRLRSVLVPPFAVTAQPRDYSDQIGVLRLVLFWRLECVTDIRERDVWPPAVQLYVQWISFVRIPMARQTHDIKLKRSVTLREPRERQRTPARDEIGLSPFTIAI